MTDDDKPEDEFDDIEIERFLDPAVVVAHHLIERALESYGGIAGAQGRLVFVMAPEEWIAPLASALKGGRAAVLTFERQLTAFQANRETVAAQVALRAGRGAFVLATDAKHVPPDISAAADVRVTLPEVDAAALAQAAGAACGEPPPALESSPPGVTPGMLRMARRKGEGAREYAARVSAIAAAAQPAAADRPGLSGLHGMDAAVAWGRALARDLGEYRAGNLAWADVDKGCMLSGPPGCGKTTFAKRLAAECGVPLVATSYGEWQSSGGGYLGDVTKAIAAAFKRARAAAPCILFIDELDSVRSRGGATRHDDWWTAIINCLLAELDGIEGRDGVVVVGASNFAERVDPALRRSGRLDREIRIALPDAAALALILRGFLGESLVDTELAPVAIRALGGTGADCECWVRGARRRARHAGREMAPEDLLAEIRGERGRERSAGFLRRVAVHEAGHVLAYHILRPGTVLSASIRGAGLVAGGVRVAPNDTSIAMAQEIHQHLVCCLSGRAAEEEMLREASGGCGGAEDSDLAEATHLAALAELSLGFGAALVWNGAIRRADVGAVLLARPDVAERVEQRLQAAYADARELVRGTRAVVEAVARALVERETMSGAELALVISAAGQKQGLARPSEAPLPKGAGTAPARGFN